MVAASRYERLDHRANRILVFDDEYLHLSIVGGNVVERNKLERAAARGSSRPNEARLYDVAESR